MALANRDVVRRKAGNRSVEVLPDADIDEAIQGSDAIVFSATSKFDWSEQNDPGYYAVKEISELFAAADLLSRYQSDRDWAKEEYERAEYYLKVVRDNFSATTGNEEQGNVVTIVAPEFQTYPKNPSALYRRPFGKGGEAIEGLLHHTLGTSQMYET
jgi:hypothetical protein